MTKSTTTLRPGVVTGDDLHVLIASCKEGNYALPAVNVISSHTINATLEAAAKAKSDVIVQMSNSGAQFVAGLGLQNALKGKILGAVAAAQHVHLLAEHYGVCVILHTDHANRKLVPWVDGMIDEGEKWFEKTGKPLFSSHMLDLSEDDLESNLSECSRVLKRLSAIDMSLEIELGMTGGEEDGVGADIDPDGDDSHLYTNPDDVLVAYETLSPLGKFSIAASFGNVHGVYKPGNVTLKPEILANSQAKVRETHNTGPNPLDLAFHGGSGSAKEKITEAIGYGVFKMNIDTDTQFAFATAIGTYVEENPRAFRYQLDPDDGTPYKKVYDPRKWLRKSEESFRGRLCQAFEDLGAVGKSIAG
ncbi:MAG: class II fructose-bisphosphate aldolase [Kofleriaceae bacterium]|nr:class II fructose-bisphosphate aldolase [Kofleriaceae bacterium]